VTGRRWGRAVLYGLLAVAAVTAFGEPASASPTGREATGSVTIFPQGIAPNFGSGLLSTGDYVYYEMVDENGNTTIGQIDPNGNARTATTPGSAYLFSPPTWTSDGGIWFAVQSGGGGGAAPGDSFDLGVARLDPATWQVNAMSAPADVAVGLPSVADREGRFWTQGSLSGGLVAIGAGVTGPLVVASTDLQLVSSGTDVFASNPIVLGPDGGVWMLGPDNRVGGLRIVSVGPAGIEVNVAPGQLKIGALALVPAGGRVWTFGADRAGGLVAVGVDPAGATATVATRLKAGCFPDLVQPVYDGNGQLWFSGADNADCSSLDKLLLAAVDVRRDSSTSLATGLSVLNGGVSTVLPVGGGVIVAGLDAAGDLGFARVVGQRIRLLETGLQPWLAPGQGRYPLVGDGGNGAWAQAVDADGKLVLVHVTPAKVVTIATGVKPAAREVYVGPHHSVWTQGIQDRLLVLVKVGPNGGVTLYPTRESPTQQVLDPAPDGRGHLWFRSAEPRTGNLVLVRVDA
jgi:hypothetical protein